MKSKTTEEISIIVVNKKGQIVLCKLTGYTLNEFYESLLMVYQYELSLEMELLKKNIEYLNIFKKLDSRYPRLFLKALSFYKRIASNRRGNDETNISKNSQSTLDRYCKLFVNYFNELQVIRHKLLLS